MRSRDLERYSPTHVCTETTTNAYMWVSEGATITETETYIYNGTDLWRCKIRMRSFSLGRRSYLVAPCHDQESGRVVVIDNDVIVDEMSAQKQMGSVEKPAQAR